MVATNEFFPDNNGLYNILGNVAEMTSDQNVSYGGNYTQNAATILASPTQKNSEPDTLVGFRVVIKATKS